MFVDIKGEKLVGGGGLILNRGNEESEINNISKVTILSDLVKECQSFWERVHNFNSNSEKGKQKPY